MQQVVFKLKLIDPLDCYQRWRAFAYFISFRFETNIILHLLHQFFTFGLDTNIMKYIKSNEKEKEK